MAVKIWTSLLFVGVLACTCVPPACSQSSPATSPGAASPRVVDALLGGGLAWGTDGPGPTLWVDARVTPWRAVGFGLYGGAQWYADGAPVWPLCGRLNLHLPDLGQARAGISLGIGQYYFGGDAGSSELGVHVAFSLLWPDSKWGFEATGHASGDARSSNAATGFLTVGVTRLFP